MSGVLTSMCSKKNSNSKSGSPQSQNEVAPTEEDVSASLFFDKVVLCTTDPDPYSPVLGPCWSWKGSHTKQGYPTFWVRHRRKRSRSSDPLPRGRRTWKGEPSYRKARGTQLSVVQLMKKLATGMTFRQCVEDARYSQSTYVYMKRLCQQPGCINPLHMAPLAELRSKRLILRQDGVLRLLALGVPLSAAVRLTTGSKCAGKKLRDSLVPK